MMRYRMGGIRIPALVLTFAVITAGACARTPEQRYSKFMASGKKQIEKQDYARAVLDFKNAIQVKPNQAEPYYQLALVYLRMGRLREGALALRKSTELNPKHAAAQLKLAELMVAAHTPDLTRDAEQRVEKVLAERPGDSDALFVLAATKAQMGKPEDAEGYLREALEHTPQHLKSSVALATMKMAKKDWAGAEQALKTAVAQAPHSADAAVFLGVFYASTGKPSEAETLFRRATQIDPKNSSALLQLAALEMRTGKKDEAAQLYKQISALPDKDYRAAYGLYLMGQGDVNGAIAEFQRLAKADPEDRAIRSRLVGAYLAAKRPQDAENVLKAALRRNAKDTAALLQRSQIYLQNGKYAEAQSDLTTVLRQEPASAEAHYLSALVDKARGAAAQHRQELGEAVRLKPGLLPARIELADALIKAKDAKAALDTLNAAPDSQKKTIPFIVARNYALIAQGDQAAVRKGVDEGLAIARTPDLLFQDGIVKLAVKDYTRARSSFQEVLKQTPEDLRALEALALTYVMQKQPEAATDEIRRHVAQHSQSTRLQMFLANWLMGQKKPGEARAVLAAVKAADPKNVAADLSLAKIDFGEGKLDEARQILSGVLASNPQDAAARLLLAMVENRAGHQRQAIESYRKVLEVDQTNILAMNNLAYELSQKGELEEALRYAQKAKELAPDDSHVEDTLGWVYYRKGLYEMAAKELERAASREQRPLIKYHLGVTYIKLGDTARGKQMVAAALTEDPKLTAEFIQ